MAICSSCILLGDLETALRRMQAGVINRGFDHRGKSDQDLTGTTPATGGRRRRRCRCRCGRSPSSPSLSRRGQPSYGLDWIVLAELLIPAGSARSPSLDSARPPTFPPSTRRIRHATCIQPNKVPPSSSPPSLLHVHPRRGVNLSRITIAKSFLSRQPIHCPQATKAMTASF